MLLRIWRFVLYVDTQSFAARTELKKGIPDEKTKAAIKLRVADIE